MEGRNKSIDGQCTPTLSTCITCKAIVTKVLQRFDNFLLALFLSVKEDKNARQKAVSAGDRGMALWECSHPLTELSLMETAKLFFHRSQPEFDQ